MHYSKISFVLTGNLKKVSKNGYRLTVAKIKTKCKNKFSVFSETEAVLKISG